MYRAFIRHSLTTVTVMNAKYKSTINYTCSVIVFNSIIHSVNIITLVKDA